MNLYVPFNRIIMHHTGGGYVANATDKQAYHTITNGDGEIVLGTYSIQANRAGLKLVEGRYAAHTKGLNSGSIGKALASMGKSTWDAPYASKFFPKPEQVDRFLYDVAETSVIQLIPVTQETILSHAEVQRTLGVKQRNKWDFDYSIFGRTGAARDPIGLGRELRQEIARLVEQIQKSGKNATLAHEREVMAESIAQVTLRRGMVGDDVKALQKFLKITQDGAYGPATEEAVRKFQKKHQLRPDGVAGPMTLAWMRKASETAL